MVLDTNVLISGIFFSGTPARVLEAWRAGRFSLVVSPLILEEYRDAVSELSASFPEADITEILDLITIHSEVVDDRAAPEPLSRDPDDDKFLACAAATGATLVSGDKDLLAADGVLGVKVLSPRAFLASIDE